MDSISIQRRTFYKILQLFVFAFIVVALVSILALDDRIRSEAKSNLMVRKQSVEQVFNNYLTRAEYEMGYISQDLMLGDYKPGNELEVLFAHHEVLFFGGLDFFYIDWNDRPNAIDPRSRVYTENSLKALLPAGRINRWVKVSTQDGADLLMYKKKLISKQRQLLGYLYGFISLNNNLTLSSELLDGAKADLIQLYDSHTGSLLLKEGKVGLDASESVVSIVGDVSTPIENSQFRVSIAKRMPITDSMISAWLRILGFTFLLFVVLYLLIMWLVRRLIFTPLTSVIQQPENRQVVYTELQPIQAKSMQYRTFLEAKEQRFQLLLQSTHSAIIFCNEMAEVESINREAMRLFPNYVNTRTIFDFMPIDCHQSIQEALKGGVGVSFELTIAPVSGIYHWQIYSFFNENGFRSVVLVGQDITQEKRLSWQLEQLKPNSLDLHQRLEVDVLLGEMTQLAKMPMYSSPQYLRGWISLLLGVIEDLRETANQSGALESIGHLLSSESESVFRELGLSSELIRMDCSVQTGAVSIPTTPAIRSLLRLLLMMVIANDMPEKRIAVRFEEGELGITINTDVAPQAFVQWGLNNLLSRLGGQLHKLRAKAISVSVPCEHYSAVNVELPDSLAVAWIVNDYPYPDKVEESLQRLDARFERYSSRDDFFMQASALNQYDAVIIGSDQDSDVLRSMTKDLQVHHNRDGLPVIWLSTKAEDAQSVNVFAVQGCLFDYSLHRALLEAVQREPIVPTHLGERGLAWVIIGGSRVSKAIWYTELEQRSVASQWLADLSEYEAILTYHPEAVVVLLEPQPVYLLRRIQSRYPKVAFFSVRDWADRPDNVTLFEMNTPYSGEQIRVLEEFVQCQK